MTYRVEVTEGATLDAEAAYEWFAERTSHAAAWFNGLVDAIEGLAELPTRCKLALESAEFDEPVRQLLYGNSPHVYRILFIIRADVVYILHVRHGARQAMGRSDVALPPEGGTPH